MRSSAAARALTATAPVFAALGDETRLRLVSRLCEGGPQSIVKLTEDADVTVHCPDSMTPERCDALEMYAAERTSQLLLDEGFSILVLVFEPKERVAAENAAYRATLKQKAS